MEEEKKCINFTSDLREAANHRAALSFTQTAERHVFFFSFSSLFTLFNAAQSRRIKPIDFYLFCRACPRKMTKQKKNSYSYKQEQIPV